jgi:hypothetical protein
LWRRQRRAGSGCLEGCDIRSPIAQTGRLSGSTSNVSATILHALFTDPATPETLVQNISMAGTGSQGVTVSPDIIQLIRATHTCAGHSFATWSATKAPLCPIGFALPVVVSSMV